MLACDFFEKGICWTATNEEGMGMELLLAHMLRLLERGGKFSSNSTLKARGLEIFGKIQSLSTNLNMCMFFRPFETKLNFQSQFTH